MANITDAEAADAIPKLWLATAIGHLKANLVLGRYVRRDGDEAVAEQGDTVNIVKRGALTVRTKTANTAVTPDTPTNTKIAVVLDTHEYVAWHAEDVTSDKAIRQGLDYAGDAAMKLAESMEAKLLGLYTEIANEVGAGGAGLDEAAILAARKKLNELRCPMMNRLLITSPAAESDVLALDKMTRADARGDGGAALREGSIGRVHGFDVFMSQLVATTGATQHNIALHPDAFMLVTRPMPLPEAGSGAIGVVMVDPDLNIALRYTRQWDSDHLKTKHVIDCLYGVKAVDEDRLAVEVLS
jgi:hypothetical protein